MDIRQTNNRRRNTSLADLAIVVVERKEESWYCTRRQATRSSSLRPAGASAQQGDDTCVEKRTNSMACALCGRGADKLGYHSS